MNAPLNPAGWIDTAASPPQRLPDNVDAAVAYVSDALGHPVYTRWTRTLLKRGCPSLADAKREHPTVFALLLDHEAAVEYWERGRLKIVAAPDAPPAEAVLARVLTQHRRRFIAIANGVTDGDGPVPAPGAAAPTATGAWLATLDPQRTGAGAGWLARAGRYMNPSAVTNTLGVTDDAQAIMLFLRDRASRSPHTLRAYVADLKRLIAWCERDQPGPLSDLTRNDLLAYRRELERGPGPGVRVDAGARTGITTGAGTGAGTGTPLRTRARAPRPVHRRHPDGPSAATPARALAVLSSLFRYWQKTGYVIANPAADLSGGSAARSGWTPTRIMPATAIALCDAVVAGPAPAGLSPLAWARRCAVWSLYRYAGARLAELVWSDPPGLPRLDVDADNQWTLHVLGKGVKLRAIPLPTVCVPALRAYRVARGLSPEPPPFEQLPLIHSDRRNALGASGLYDEVKAVLHAAEAHVATEDAATLAALRAASTHWLRHGYARALVVDHAVPLPVAQGLLGHASVQTTAAYARTDLTQTRAFVEGSFPQT